MTLEQIRKNPEMVARLRAILDDPDMKRLIEAVLFALPATTVDSDISDTFSHISFGANLAHHRFHHLLLSGGTHFATPASPQDAAMALEPEDDDL